MIIFIIDMYILYLYFTHTLVGMTYSYVFVCVYVCPRHGILRKAVGAHLLPAQLGDSRLKQMRPSHQEPWCMKIGYTPPPCFSFLSFFHIVFPYVPYKNSTILWVSENPPFSDRPLLDIIGCGGRKQKLQHIVVQCATVRAWNLLLDIFGHVMKCDHIQQPVGLQNMMPKFQHIPSGNLT